MASDTPPLNVFANDGSFFDQFRKKIASQSKNTEPPPNSSCQKQRPNFKPKSSFKPINLKASFKKQLKSNLIPKSKSTSLLTVNFMLLLRCNHLTHYSGRC